jgi:hypothetical protein
MELSVSIKCINSERANNDISMLTVSYSCVRREKSGGLQ